jgi:cell division protein FtsN
MEIKTIIEKVLVDGKSKYAVRIGVFSSKEEALVVFHKLPHK